MILGDRKLAFRIKVTSAPKLAKGFYQAVSDIAPEASFVVYRTDEIWSGGEGITHTSVEHLASLLKSDL